MEKLNLMNAERLIFRDESLCRKLPEFKGLFDQWKLSIASPSARQSGKKAVLDFLRGINYSHLAIISDHLGFELVSDPIDYRRVKNFAFPRESLDFSFSNFQQNENLLIYLERDELSITSWR